VHTVPTLPGRLAQSLQRLGKARAVAPLVAILERFSEIEGTTQAGLLSIQLFTVLIPLIIIGFAHFSGFARNASVGDLFIRDLGLPRPLGNRVRDAFGTSSALESVATFIGVAGFLVWGIPMSIRVAGMFARAWRRPQLGKGELLARGAAWFVLLLGTMIAHQRIGFAGQPGAGIRAVLLVVGFLPVWIFWSLTPVLLVRHGGWGWRDLLRAGLAGAVIDGIILAAIRLAFPSVLEAWTGFGPMGVAMTLMTWCGVLATGWVVIACAGAVVWERHALANQGDRRAVPPTVSV
jgi:uncharacterized BrkB/YihY/UPF0761 family membrane protein